jgi:hypothetical protein
LSGTAVVDITKYLSCSNILTLSTLAEAIVFNQSSMFGSVSLTLSPLAVAIIESGIVRYRAILSFDERKSKINKQEQTATVSAIHAEPLFTTKERVATMATKQRIPKVEVN